MKSSPKVTVLMPVYNGEKYISAAVDSILNQTFEDFELLIIDDGSTDHTRTIVDRYSDPRVRLAHNKRNQKLIKTLNKGISLAQGEYIARMDCDDISKNNRLELQVDYLENNHDVGIVGSNAVIINKDGRRLFNTKYPEHHILIAWALYFYCPIVHPSIMIRKSLLREHGGYGVSMLHAEDYDLWSGLIAKTKFSNLPQALIHLRKHETNISQENYDIHVNNSILISQKSLGRLLGYKAGADALRCIKYRQCQTLESRITAAELINSVRNNFLNRGSLDAKSRKLVYQDATQRKLAILLPALFFPSTWKLVFSAVSENPFALARLFKLIAEKLIQKAKLMALS